MHKKVIIVFWGHPLYDGRCMNMLNQLSEQGYQISILGVGSKKETCNKILFFAVLLKQTKLQKWLKYNKNYYSDSSLSPSEEIFFSISIIPLSQVNSPNIRK